MRLLKSSLTVLLLAHLSSAFPQITNNAPFSGIVYIVDPNGQPISAATTNMCPAQAPVSCGSAGPSYCCPQSYTCASPANNGNGLLGCCPSGTTCGGAINVASVTTVTVQAAPPPETSFVLVQPPQSTVVVVNNDPPPTQYQQGFCSTLTMDGPGLPTTAQGDCGVILVVSEGAVNWKELRALGYGAGVVVLVVHGVVGRMLGWI